VVAFEAFALDPPEHVRKIDIANDQNVAGATLLNPLIAAVEAAFAPDNPVHQTQTLGGLVQAVYIDGATVKAISDVDIDHGQGGAVIPVRILIP
jgi:hypothetical protein